MTDYLRRDPNKNPEDVLRDYGLVRVHPENLPPVEPSRASWTERIIFHPMSRVLLTGVSVAAIMFIVAFVVEEPRLSKTFFLLAPWAGILTAFILAERMLSPAWSFIVQLFCITLSAGMVTRLLVPYPRWMRGLPVRKFEQEDLFWLLFAFLAGAYCIWKFRRAR